MIKRHSLLTLATLATLAFSVGCDASSNPAGSDSDSASSETKNSSNQVKLTVGDKSANLPPSDGKMTIQYEVQGGTKADTKGADDSLKVEGLYVRVANKSDQMIFESSTRFGISGMTLGDIKAKGFDTVATGNKKANFKFFPENHESTKDMEKKTLLLASKAEVSFSSVASPIKGTVKITDQGIELEYNFE